MTRVIRSRRAGLSRDQARQQPLYARLLGLQYLTPSGFLCFVFFEGAVALGVLLALAELVSWWGVLVLPVTVAVMVKLNDVVAGALTHPNAVAARSRGARDATPRAARWAPDDASGLDEAGSLPAASSPALRRAAVRPATVSSAGPSATAGQLGVADPYPSDDPRYSGDPYGSGDGYPFDRGDGDPHDLGDGVPYNPGDGVPYNPGDGVPYHPGHDVSYNPGEPRRSAEPFDPAEFFNDAGPVAPAHPVTPTGQLPAGQLPAGQLPAGQPARGGGIPPVGPFTPTAPVPSQPVQWWGAQRGQDEPAPQTIDYRSWRPGSWTPDRQFAESRISATRMRPVMPVVDATAGGALNEPPAAGQWPGESLDDPDQWARQTASRRYD